MSTSKSNGKSEDLFGNSSLDHALLESLFYTETMHMTDADSSVLSNQLLSSLTADGAVVAPPPASSSPEKKPAATPRAEMVDPNVAAEKDLLNHFGVHNDEFKDQTAATATTTSAAAKARTTRPVKTTAKTTTAKSTSALPRLKLASPDSQVSSITASLLPNLAPPPKTAPVAPASAPVARSPVPAALNPPPVAAPSVAAAASAAPPVMAEEDKRSKLVNQFATLASRLGINLPNNVLQSLTQQVTSGATGGGGGSTARTTADNLPATVQQLAATAEAAIASVGRKRTRSESPPTHHPVASAAPSSAVASASASAAAAKRRKKPRLVECEHKLAELKAENAMLKRHLANVSAQSHQLEQDRQSQEARMRQMEASGSTEQELDQAIQTFQDMYSDYGRRRHSEITFHLDQLLRLANPTNFTKMGLWTMGQQSKNNRNPIASILQKELGITSQQGRKILEQREKIRNVCDNMKETLRLLTQLKALCEQKTKIFHDRMTKCREILKPSQVVKCLTWIDQNSETLAKLCPGWSHETFVGN